MDYARIYSELILKRKKETPDGYTEKHHVLPRSLGGSDGAHNIVILTAKEHYVAHLLLTKMYARYSVEYFKMVSAFMMMINCTKTNRHITSNNYAKLKSDYSMAMSISQTGTGNTQYGTIWIYSQYHRLSKRINKTEDIPVGWEKGRVVDFSYLDRVCIQCDSHLNIINKKVLKKICDECKIHNKNTVKRKYVVLHDQYVKSNCKNVSEFSKGVGLSVVSLTQNWHKYIEGYKNIYNA